ncbi:hypothetical protein [Paraburkholderia sp. BR13444]|uniref:hypothetical protein n=1 Tax=Paraburkholderia sp. BR13444 TaxID=3236997 RepID=UPI0034CFB934
MLPGIAAMFAVPYHTLFHPTSAVLFGTGYGLAYPVITLPSRLSRQSGAATRFAARSRKGKSPRLAAPHRHQHRPLGAHRQQPWRERRKQQEEKDSVDNNHDGMLNDK